jgi:hypothetical protein
MRRVALAGIVAVLLVSGCGGSTATEVDVSHACTEDSFCWQPLLYGNHLGAVRPMEVTR